jgi:hypothetical protein
VVGTGVSGMVAANADDSGVGVVVVVVDVCLVEERRDLRIVGKAMLVWVALLLLRARGS